MASETAGSSASQTAGQEQEKQITAAGKIRSSRQALVDLVQSSEPAPATDALGAAPSPRKGGWIPWFVENRLYILGWVRTDGPVYGVELELMTLLSRLITDFPAEETDGAVYTLKDDTGEILHQIGTDQIDRDAEPESILSLAPQLPHWELAVYTPGKEATPPAARGFLILAGLLLFIFLAAIIFGGGMLTWQAHRNHKDALEKTTFVSNVSHELKTPLTSIRMYAELLFAERVTDPHKKRRYLQVIVSETRRLTRLVNNVLDFSRLEQGKKKYRPEALDLTEHIKEVLSSHALPVKEAGMVLKTAIPDKTITVHTDRDAVDQVMLNLIDNAVKYAAGGGELKVSLMQESERARIEVSDKGPGVSDAHRERIFEQFHRVDDSLTAKQQGSGLGLSIARRILRDLGGDLTYRPGNDGGSCFVVSLPIHAEQ
jgi:signal transduction histidine kinase